MPRGRTATAPASEMGGEGGGMTPNPFVRAAWRLTESFLDKSLAVTASAQSVDIAEIPARGWLRGVWLWVTASGGAAGAGTTAQGFPYNVIDRVEIQDVNSAPIVSLSGWELYLVNLLGGYAFHPNVRDSEEYSGGTATPGFMVWVPIEVRSRDGMGSLPNMDGQNPFRLKITLAASGTIYAKAVTTNPTVRFRAFDEHWAPPPPNDIAGRPNNRRPPGVGTTSYWTAENHVVVNGANTVRVVRTGNYIRNLILIGLTSGGAPADTVLPDPLELRYDGTILMRVPLDLLREKQLRNIPRAISANDRPVGVVLLPFNDDLDGHSGEEVGNFYLPTTSATRLEIRGTNSAAGSLRMLVNDLAPGQSGSLY